MDVIIEVKEKLKRKHQILFDKKSLFLQDLMFLIKLNYGHKEKLKCQKLKEQF